MKRVPLVLVVSLFGCAGSQEDLRHTGPADGGAEAEAGLPDAPVATVDAGSDGTGESSVVPVEDAASCDGESGDCGTPCNDDGLKDDSLGCEHYAISTASGVANSFQFGVVVTNPEGFEVSVEIEGGELFAPLNKKVAGFGSLEIALPWVPKLKGKSCIASSTKNECGAMSSGSVRVPGGAYRIRSSRPVRVVQLNPLEYLAPGGSSIFSSDAALLFPKRTLGKNHRVVSRPAWTSPLGGGPNPGFIAIAAVDSATSVTIEATAKIASGSNVPEIASGATYTTTLAAGEVLELFGYEGDLTGTSVSADQPIAVVSGHYCASPSADSTGFCQHLEESVPAVEHLGTSWFVVPPMSQFQGVRPETVRIVATEANTELTYDPVEPGAPTSIAVAGAFVDLPPRTSALAITASQPVLVVESMHLDLTTWGPIGGVGNFAMTLAVSEQSLRDDISFAKPSVLDLAWVQVVAPLSGASTLDGNVLTGVTPIGESGFGFVRASLWNGSDGTHRLVGASGFGATLVGYSQTAGASLWHTATP